MALDQDVYGGIVGGVDDFNINRNYFNGFIEKKNKNRKKRMIIWLLVVGAIIGVTVLVLQVVTFSGGGNMKGVRDAYWVYMNYLILGDSSSDILSEDEYGDVENTAAKKAFNDGNVAYFETLDKMYGEFYSVFEKASSGIKDSYLDDVIVLKERVEFITDLVKVGSPSVDEWEEFFMSGESVSVYEENYLRSLMRLSDRSEEYINDRLTYANSYQEYLRSISDTGCLLADDECLCNNIGVWNCGMILNELEFNKSDIVFTENFEINALIYNSWRVGLMMGVNQ